MFGFSSDGKEETYEIWSALEREAGAGYSSAESAQPYDFEQFGAIAQIKNMKARLVFLETENENLRKQLVDMTTSFQYFEKMATARLIEIELYRALQIPPMKGG